MVLVGDAPLITADTLQRLLAAHASSPRACTLLLGVPADPSGLGRVVRDDAGHVLRIVEERDLPPGEPVPMECNGGIYVFDGSQLWPALDRLTSANAQGELYLTDVIELLTGPVEALVAPDPDEFIFINDRRQLAAAEACLRRRTLDALMLSGVTVEDPATTYVEPRRPGWPGQRHPPHDHAHRVDPTRNGVRDRPDGGSTRRPSRARRGDRRVPSGRVRAR